MALSTFILCSHHDYPPPENFHLPKLKQTPLNSNYLFFSHLASTFCLYEFDSQPWHTLFPIWNQSVVPFPVLTVVSWPAYRFFKRQVSEVKLLSHVWLFVTPWTVAYQAPPSVGFSRQEYWSGLPFPSPGDLPNPGIKSRSPTLQADALTSEPPGKPNKTGNQQGPTV